MKRICITTVYMLFLSLLFSACSLTPPDPLSHTNPDDPKYIPPNAASTKSITAFHVTESDITGTIDEENKAITLTVPPGTDRSSLTPTITHTGISISPDSGVTQNFTDPVSYTVTAEDLTTAVYAVTVIGTLSTPTFSLPEDTYMTAQSVEIHADAGSTVYYTDDGSDPDSSSTRQEYGTPISIETSTTLRAIATKTGWASSAEASAEYTITGTLSSPAFSLSSGTYTGLHSVTLDADTGATIYYTLNDTDPKTSPDRVEYTGAIDLPIGTTDLKIRAVSIKEYWEDSDESSATYTIIAFYFTESGGNVTITGYTGSDTSIIIPSLIAGNPVTIIADSAFKNKSTIIDVTLPDSVTTIYNEAFRSCTALSTISLSSSLTGIGRSAFSGCTSLTGVTIPSGVTVINPYAFSGCSSLASVTIQGDVTSIGQCAFQECGALSGITLPDTVTSIGVSAFYNCGSLESVTIPSSLSSIGGAAFAHCSSLTTDMTLPATLTSIEYQTFYDCGSLTSITIPESVTAIGFEAFYYCSSLTSITLPSQVTTLETRLFRGCSALESVTLSGAVTTIGASPFYGCSALTDITLPATVESIDVHAFRECSSLTELTLPDSVTSLGNCVFYDCSALTGMTIPAAVESMGIAVFNNCTSLTDITVVAGNTVYTSIDGVLFNAAETELIHYPSAKASTSYSVPTSVTTIGDYGFYHNTILTSVTIPGATTDIGTYAFQNSTALESVTIPAAITDIGNYAFNNCTALVSVTINATTPPSVTNYSFYGNATGRTFYVPSGSVTAYRNDTTNGWQDYDDGDIQSQ